MKNIILFRTQNQNYYIYCLSSKQFFCINENVFSLLKKAEEGVELDTLEYNEFCKDKNQVIGENDFIVAKNKAIYYLNILSSQDRIINLINRLSVEDIEYYLSSNPNICFEITENCNLDCKYCTYNDYYYGFDKRTKKNLKFADAKKIIDYIYGFCNSKNNISYKKNINISFYGGEPLLRFNVIQEIIDYTKKLANEVVNFTYSMTTNGVLLDKYIDELVNNEFELLISLDGDKQHNAHRVYRDGAESHSKIFNNILQLKELHPDYYNEHVEFNSVVHNLTNKEEIESFFKKHFNKNPDFSDLSFENIKDEKNADFINVFQTPSNHNSGNINSKEETKNQTDFSEKDGTIFISTLTRYLTKDYNTLFQTQNTIGKYTGTCIPFSRKIFVTTNGKILPCENIDHKFSFGNISKGSLTMDLAKLTEYYNQFISETTTKCKDCYRIYNCEECAFKLNKDNTTQYYSCYTNKKRFERYLSANMSDLENNTTNFQKILKDGIIL